MPSQGCDAADLLRFIADHEPLAATLQHFSDTPADDLRAQLRWAARKLARSSVADIDTPSRQLPTPTAAGQSRMFDAAEATSPPPAAMPKPVLSPERPERKTVAATGTKSRLIVYSDGACRGNPGLSGAGWVICDAQGRQIAEGYMFLGTRTNNEAEYLAAAMGVQAAIDLGAEDVLLRADSELMVRQLQGRYRVKHPKLLPLFAELKRMQQALRHFKSEHVPREQNAAADAQANLAIDKRR